MRKRIEWTSKRQMLRLAGLLLVLAVLVILSSDAIHGRFQLYHPKTIWVNGNEVVVDDTLALNGLEADDFGRDEQGRATYAAGETRTGIDVSAHQGEIDWEKVAQDGIDFAFLRVGFRGYGSGEMVEDPTFADNWAGARQQGLPLGVYFFSQAITPEEAREEARFVLERLKGQTLGLPIVYDWEPVSQTYTDGNAETIRTYGISGETVTDCALAFFEEVTAAGYEPMLYLNNDTGYFTYDIGRLQSLPVWYASYETDWPDYYYAVRAWQYTQTGTVAGISGHVDLNLWFVPEPVESGGNATDGNAAI